MRAKLKQLVMAGGLVVTPALGVSFALGGTGCGNGFGLAVNDGDQNGGAPENAGPVSEAIQGGKIDTKHPYAVGLTMIDGDMMGTCSGALIAPNLVITARHCVSQSPERVTCGDAKFGALRIPEDKVVVTTDTYMDTAQNTFISKRIILPEDARLCGNDIALIILATSVPSTLATPITPAIERRVTNREAYDFKFTAIGYGVTSPIGNDARTRRIRNAINMYCVPGDTDAERNCDQIPGAAGHVKEAEFVAEDGTCQGDSGSSAYEERSFQAGAPVTMGVLSRGGVDTSVWPPRCVGSIYTRTDMWRDLIIKAAKEAAELGGYAAPAWVATTLEPAPIPGTLPVSTPTPTPPPAPATPPESDPATPPAPQPPPGSTTPTPPAPVATDPGTPAPGTGSAAAPTAPTSSKKRLNARCSASRQCESQVCAHLGRNPSVCSARCSSVLACPNGYSCRSKFCFADNGNLRPANASTASNTAALESAADEVPGAANETQASAAGCSVSPIGQRGASSVWGSLGLALGVVAFSKRRARRA